MTTPQQTDERLRSWLDTNQLARERLSLAALAKAEGIEVVDVFDRERIRIALDAAEGLGLRFQYLSIPLSDAEQAAFFARWGNGLEQLITKSIQAEDSRLDRMEFFQEQNR